MLEKIILGSLIILEIGFVVLSFVKNTNLKREKSIVRIVLFILFILLVLTPVIDWKMGWVMLGLFLGFQAVLGAIVILKNKVSAAPKKNKLIFSCIGRCVLIWIVLIPVLIFPQYKPIKVTGNYSVSTKSLTLTDVSREETFTKEEDFRKVTIQFWYPSDLSQEEKLPLVVFSHGAFGYRMSNYSTFQELASNGYIVVSIDHTYHSFMTKQEDGETVIGNMEFIQSAMKVQNGDIDGKELFDFYQEWMDLRTKDMQFVLDFIKDESISTNADEVYRSIDIEHIGVFGHSLGGATAAQIGRVDNDVDAVIVVDGTMLGEIIGFENGKDVITDEVYSKPIMNLYNESHYEEATQLQNDYPNKKAFHNAIDSYEVVIDGSNHIDFTDLPIVSPFLANLLDTKSDVDSRYCIETTNRIILEFFDHYLKSSNGNIEKERSY